MHLIWLVGELVWGIVRGMDGRLQLRWGGRVSLSSQTPEIQDITAGQPAKQAMPIRLRNSLHSLPGTGSRLIFKPLSVSNFNSVMNLDGKSSLNHATTQCGTSVSWL